MEFLKSIIPDDWYLRFFPPEEDSKEGVQLYLHIRDGKYIIPVSPGVSRSQVVEFLKDINTDDNLAALSEQDENTPEKDLEANEEHATSTNEILQQLGDIFALPAKTISQIIIDTFNGAEIVFVGGGEVTVEHEKDPETGIWHTWFVKNIKQEAVRIACINTTKLVRW